MVEPTHATGEGTRRFRERFAARSAEGHFREALGVSVSSVGMGTYLGDPDAATDRRYADTVVAAFARGCNLIDTAINYRFQRSERAIGEGLRRAFNDGGTRREEVVIATKGGFLPYDGAFPADPSTYLQHNYADAGIADFDDLVGGCHCMTPRFLRDQIDRSRRNLGLVCLDLYFLHNPEQQLEEVSRKDFRRRIRGAFAALEEAAEEGKIRWYGLATWDGLLLPPEAKGHLSLQELVEVAAEVAKGKPRLRAIELPYSLVRPDAAVVRTQEWNGEGATVLEAARKLGLAVLASAPFAQGKLARVAPDWTVEAFPGLKTPAQRALHFVRSTPGVTTVLAGMSRVSHAEENLAISNVSPLAPPAARELLARVA
ncbi:MAG TPA: aldo/keto reductase [Planctomycetota bacterium]|nr:aldo/keto reductase [Planctomycetota bacterium]